MPLSLFNTPQFLPLRYLVQFRQPCGRFGLHCTSGGQSALMLCHGRFPSKEQEEDYAHRYQPNEPIFTQTVD